jgi:hypothetical protein
MLNNDTAIYCNNKTSSVFFNIFILKAQLGLSIAAFSG